VGIGKRKRRMAQPAGRTRQEHPSWLFTLMKLEKVGSSSCHVARCFASSGHLLNCSKRSTRIFETVKAKRRAMAAGPKKDDHGNLLPMRRSDTSARYRASNMPRVFGRLGYETQANPE
jgi:hypothetical protein